MNNRNLANCKNVCIALQTFSFFWAIFPFKLPANCLRMTLAFSFSEDLIVLYCYEGPQGSPESVIYFCHLSVCLI